MDYLRLARALDRIASTPSRREKVTVAADLLTSAPGHVLADVARLLVGQVLAPWRGESMGANVQTVGEALCEAGGYSPERLARTMEETRELGLAAERLTAHRLQSTLAPAPLTCVEVHELLRAMAAQRGDGAQGRKVDILRALFTRAEPLETRYLVRAVLGRPLVGLSVGLAEDAMAEAFGVPAALMRRSCAMLPDCGEVALHAHAGCLEEVRMEVSRPIRPMPMQPLDDLRAKLEASGPMRLSARFGGVYLQMHRRGEETRMFTRGLWDVSASLVELGQIFGALRAQSAVVEGEVVVSGGEAVTGEGVHPPHVDVAHRLGRKHHHDTMLRCFPLRFYAHDLVFLDGADLTGVRHAYRWQLLERLAGESGLELAPAIMANSPADVDEFMDEAEDLGARSVAAYDPHAAWGPDEGGRYLLRLAVKGGPKD